MAQILPIAFYFANIIPSQSEYNYNNIPSTNQENEKIDLRQYGDKIYGYPKSSSGDLLQNWDPRTSRNNPEENGEYFEGDILFPLLGRNAIISESYRWHNRIIPYAIEDTFYDFEINRISEAIDDFHRTTCLRFVPRTNEFDYIAFTSEYSGCWSSVGKLGGRQVVNLQRPGCVYNKAIPAHEIIHALGFFHEQSRSDRDYFVEILPQNIIPNQIRNFNKELTTAFGVQYDYDSVMHYSEYAFSSNGQKTIQPRGVRIGQRIQISPKDIEKINKMYGCGSQTDFWRPYNFYSV